MINTLADKELTMYDKDFTIMLNINMGDANALTPKMVLVPVYKFIEKFLRIMDKDGHNIPFKLNPDQIELYKQICEQRRQDKPVRINILKARQIGFSTFIAAIIFTTTLFNPGRNACIVADIAGHATGLFSKYKFFYDNLPQAMKQELPMVRSNAKEVQVRYPNGVVSAISVIVQGESSGRGSTNQYLHLSECAFWDDLNGTVTSLLSTVSNLNKDSMIFFETTAHGMNDYKEMWDSDMGGNSNFKALFFGWWSHKEYRMPWDVTWSLEDWEKDLQKELNLDNEQMAWYHSQYLSVRRDKDKLRQEYPSNPVEAFITSGNSVFNAELVQQRKIEVSQLSKKIKRGYFTYKKKYSLDGKRIDVTDVKWVDDIEGEVKIFEEPIKGMPYVVANDPAMGGEDYYATQVFNNFNCHQVAVYHRNKCDSDDCAFQMYCLGKYFEDAMITGETNTTAYMLQMCQKCGYRNIYQDTDGESLGVHYFDRLGFKTKQTNRSAMIDMFKISFREDPSIINDWDTLCEMETFQVVKNTSTKKEKVEAAGNSHDDLVMACCGFFWCRKGQRASPLPQKQEDDQYTFDPFKDFTPNNNEVQGVYQIWD